MLQAKFPIDWSAPLKEKRWHAHPHYGTRVKHETEKKKSHIQMKSKKKRRIKIRFQKSVFLRGTGRAREHKAKFRNVLRHCSLKSSPAAVFSAAESFLQIGERMRRDVVPAKL